MIPVEEVAIHKTSEDNENILADILFPQKIRSDKTIVNIKEDNFANESLLNC